MVSTISTLFTLLSLSSYKFCSWYWGDKWNCHHAQAGSEDTPSVHVSENKLSLSGLVTWCRQNKVEELRQLPKLLPFWNMIFCCWNIINDLVGGIFLIIKSAFIMGHLAPLFSAVVLLLSFFLVFNGPVARIPWTTYQFNFDPLAVKSKRWFPSIFTLYFPWLLNLSFY